MAKKRQRYFTLRQLILPHLRQMGIAEAARKSGINRSQLNLWATGESNTHAEKKAGLRDEQIDTLLKALDLKVSIERR